MPGPTGEMQMDAHPCDDNLLHRLLSHPGGWIFEKTIPEPMAPIQLPEAEWFNDVQHCRRLSLIIIAGHDHTQLCRSPHCLHALHPGPTACLIQHQTVPILPGEAG